MVTVFLMYVGCSPQMPQMNDHLFGVTAKYEVYQAIKRAVYYLCQRC